MLFKFSFPGNDDVRGNLEFLGAFFTHITWKGSPHGCLRGEVDLTFGFTRKASGKKIEFKEDSLICMSLYSSRKKLPECEENSSFDIQPVVRQLPSDTLSDEKK